MRVEKRKGKRLSGVNTTRKLSVWLMLAGEWPVEEMEIAFSFTVTGLLLCLSLLSNTFFCACVPGWFVPVCPTSTRSHFILSIKLIGSTSWFLLFPATFSISSQGSDSTLFSDFLFLYFLDFLLTFRLCSAAFSLTFLFAGFSPIHC